MQLVPIALLTALLPAAFASQHPDFSGRGNSINRRACGRRAPTAGDIPVKSRAADADRLVIRSTSKGTEKGAPVTIETRRVIWLDESGDLIIERTGTPASAVTPSRSVYSKVR